jgi:hypothetical protein
MIGNGDGTFGPPIAYGQTGPWPVDLFIGDFNGDKVDDFGMPTQDSTSGVDVVNLYLTAPALNLFPTALNFGVQPVGKTSPSKKIELTNAGNARLRISKVTTSGNFLEQNQCGTGLGIGKDCSAQIFFKPAAKGVRAGEVSILDNARSSPQQVQLSGVGK